MRLEPPLPTDSASPGRALRADGPAGPSIWRASSCIVVGWSTAQISLVLRLWSLPAVAINCIQSGPPM